MLDETIEIGPAGFYNAVALAFIQWLQYQMIGVYPNYTTETYYGNDFTTTRSSFSVGNQWMKFMLIKQSLETKPPPSSADSLQRDITASTLIDPLQKAISTLGTSSNTSKYIRFSGPDVLLSGSDVLTVDDEPNVAETRTPRQTGETPRQKSIRETKSRKREEEEDQEDDEEKSTSTPKNKKTKKQKKKEEEEEQEEYEEAEEEEEESKETTPTGSKEKVVSKQPH